MRTAYVERPAGDPPSATDSFDRYATSLDDLATSLLACLTSRPRCSLSTNTDPSLEHRTAFGS